MIDEIKARVDIVELISRSEPHLRQIGNAYRSGHYSKHPSTSGDFKGTSLEVSPSRGCWHCWECANEGAQISGGSAIDWVMSDRNCSVGEAIVWLGAEYGIKMDGFHPEEYADKKRIRGIMKEAVAFYHQQLTPELRTHLNQRGMTDATIDELMIGYAPPGGDALRVHLREKHSKKDLLATGFFHQAQSRAYDHYQDRIIFPYWFHDEVVYSIGRLPPANATERHENDKSKYKKQLTHSESHPYVSETAVQHCIYGQNSIRGKKEIILTEGIIDAILTIQAGYACLSPVTIRFQKKDIDTLVSLTRQVDIVFIGNDNEENKQGEKGALDTAQALFAAGADVRILNIPKPEGVKKVDLADYLSTGGTPEMLCEGATPFLDLEIGKIAGTSGKSRIALLDTFLAQIKTRHPVEQDEILQKLVDAGAGRLSTLKKQIKVAGKVERTETETIRFHRKVKELDTGYWAWDDEAEENHQISNFVIVPKVRVIISGQEVITADYVGENRRIESIVIGRTDWNDKKLFMNVIPTSDFWFDGTLSHIQSILAIVASYDVPTKTGTDKIGRHDDLWLLPEGAIDKAGAVKDPHLIYIPYGGRSEWQGILENPVRPSSAPIAKELAARLLSMNTLPVMGAVIGWFFATPFKDQWTAMHGGFPFLHITGTQGAGKSSLLQIFARLFGYKDTSTLFSCDATPFVLLRLLSSTTTIPVILEEYKSDLPLEKRILLKRYIRRCYNGEVEMRGNADKSLTTYTLTAPIVLAGEIEMTEGALMERMIFLPIEKGGLTQESKAAYHWVRDLPLHAMQVPYLRYCLSVSFEDEYRAIPFNDYIPPCPERVSNNLRAIAFGCHQFNKFGGAELSEAEITVIVGESYRSLVESREHVKIGLDTFIGHLAIMAETGRLKSGTHFIMMKNGERLALRIGACFAEFQRYARETTLTDEMLPLPAYHRQIRENEAGYIMEVNHPVRFGDNSVRKCCVIDVEAAHNAGIEGIDAFAWIGETV